MFSQFDHAMMARALRLAERGRYSAHPNPRVGCVVSSHGEIIGEGWHQRTGEAHAEINALKNLSNLLDATVFVTLEPCVHEGRTPPCVDALIAAKPGRVVVAVGDPNPKVAGKGIARLREAGINVEEGLLAGEARALNEGFFRRMQSGRPRVIAKMAMSLDGRIALADGHSRWITGDEARRDAHRLRAECGAVLTGTGTVAVDDPRLNVRLPGSWRQPLRAVVDSQLKTSASARLFEPGDGAIVFTTQADETRAAELRKKNVEIIEVSATENRCNLQDVLAELARREVNDVLLEAGPTLAGAMLRSALVNELVAYLAPCLLGDQALPAVRLPRLLNMDERLALEVREMIPVGKDIRIRMKVNY